VKMQFRADFFNFPNHPNFANPFLPSYIADPTGTVANPACNNGTGPGTCNFTIVGSGATAREVGNGPYRISATGDVGIGNPFIGGGGPRGIQLAVKFSF